MGVAGRLVVSVVMLGASQLAGAGTLHITVREHGGDPVSDASVRAISLAEGTPMPWSRSAGHGITDLRGEVRLDLPVGRYQVGVEQFDDPTLVLPERNPRAPPVLVDVPQDGTADALVELWRGRRVRFELEANRTAPNLTVHPVSSDGLPADDVVLREMRMDAEVTLLPGRWIFGADVTPGWLLTDLRVDGASVPGSEARIEIAPGANTVVLTWVVEGQAMVGGSILVDAPTPCATQGAVATLLEPGPWITAAQARGGSVYDVVEVGIDDGDRCAFSMILPSGRWGVAPRLAPTCTMMPDPPEVTLAPGASAWVHLRGACEPPDGNNRGEPVGLGITVVDADGKPLERAHVEITQQVQPGDDPVEPLTADTDEGGLAWLRVPPGHAWHIVAGHGAHLDAATDLERWPPENGDPSERVTITLRRASSVRVRAVDATGKALPGVAVGLKVLGEPDDLLTDEKWRAYRRGRAETSDSQGEILMRGLHPLDVAMIAALRGADRESWIVSLRQAGGDFSDEQPLAVSLRDGEETVVDVRVRPAARLLAHLAPSCAHVPDETELVVVPATRLTPDADDMDALLVQPTLAQQRLPRSGVDKLELEIGPLATGSYLLALRPTGFERWTLWPGTEIPFEADAIEAVEGDVVRLEGLTIDCAPVAEIRLHPPAGARSPDMRLADVQASWKSVDPKREPIPLTVRRLPTRVRLSGLPKGKGVITATLRHPHLLPTGLVTFDQAVDMKDGSLALLEKDVAEVGGAIVVTTTAPYVRINATGSEDPGRIIPADAGRASFASLRAGSWTLTECADASCASVLQGWNAVLEAHRTLTLP